MAHESKKTQQENARFVRKSCRDILVKIRIGLVEERSGFQFWKRDKVKNKPFSFCPLSRELITMKKIWKYHENQRHRISTICKFQNFIASGTKMCKNCTLRLKGYFGRLRLMGLRASPAWFTWSFSSSFSQKAPADFGNRSSDWFAPLPLSSA